jgi:hypothetical protein
MARLLTRARSTHGRARLDLLQQLGESLRGAFAFRRDGSMLSGSRRSAPAEARVAVGIHHHGGGVRDGSSAGSAEVTGGGDAAEADEMGTTVPHSGQRSPGWWARRS